MEINIWPYYSVVLQEIDQAEKSLTEETTPDPEQDDDDDDGGWITFNLYGHYNPGLHTRVCDL